MTDNVSASAGNLLSAGDGNGQSPLDTQSVETPSTVARNIQDHTLSGLSDLDSSVNPELGTQPTHTQSATSGGYEPAASEGRGAQPAASGYDDDKEQPQSNSTAKTLGEHLQEFNIIQ